MLTTLPRFVDDIPRWASLLNSEDRSLFSEISSHLWGESATFMNQENFGHFDEKEALRKLQELVERLVGATRLFDHGSANTSGTYRLYSLRQQHSSSVDDDYVFVKRRSLAEWDPLPPEVRKGLHNDDPKPPDLEEKHQHFSILARITTLMAGAIFGAILLYLYCTFPDHPHTSTLTS